MIREQTQRTAGTGPNRAEEIYEKCLKRDPLTAEEAYWLYEQAPLQELALTADRVRRAVVPDLEVVTWQIDRNVNITNVCISGCHFCNFHCKPHQTERAFITTLDEYKERIVIFVYTNVTTFSLQFSRNIIITKSLTKIRICISAKDAIIRGK